VKHTIDLIRRAWCADTAAPGAYREACPAAGQCAVTVLLVQNILGGEILRAEVDGAGHYWNLIPNVGEVDLTRAQFDERVICSWCLGGGFYSEITPHVPCSTCDGFGNVISRPPIARGEIVPRSRLLNGPRAEAARTRERYYARAPSYDLREVKLAEVAHLFAEHHAYRSTGNACTYAFAVIEDAAPVAAFLWQPPPPGASRSVCVECPQGVLSLSRMVAVPHKARRLRHVSKPLREQMLRRIDRTRWPVLVTYSDESVGHTGHVYRCSGWTPTVRHRARTFTLGGRRVSKYSNGSAAAIEGAVAGWAWIQRWEHRADVAAFAEHWRSVELPGTWRSGAPKRTYVRVEAAA
jgi:hypothetical protein